MKIKSLVSLGAASVGAVSILASATAAQAAILGPGKLSGVLDTGIFFSGNVIDFSPELGGDRSLGTPGEFNITTSPFDAESGIFADDPLAGTPDRTFLGASGLINDLAFDKAIADALPGGGVQDGVRYSLEDDFGVVGEFSLLDFDTDGDDEFGEADDFQYILTHITRTTSQGPTGGFNVSFDFGGFFRDNLGVFENTPSDISFINGTTSQDPTAFPNIELADFIAGSGADGVVVGFTASFDKTITTGVPEPATIMGLLGVVGLAGGLLKQKKA